VSDKGKRGAAGKGAGAKAAKDKRKNRAGDSNVLSVATHPRAQARIRQAKGWGGLSAFGVTAYLSLAHGVGADMAGIRAIAAGAGGYVVAWGCGVMIWRQLMLAELRVRVDRARRQAQDDADAAEAQLDAAVAAAS
jgi:hypothetical protein